MKIGRNLILIRNSQKLSEDFVAKSLKVTLDEYRGIENDETDITLSKLEAIAEILSTSPVDILQYNDPKAGIKNYFYNQNGNNGSITNVQGIHQEEIRKGYKELYLDELKRIPQLEKLLRDNNIEFNF